MDQKVFVGQLSVTELFHPVLKNNHFNPNPF